MRIAVALLSFLLVAGCGQHGFTGLYNAPLPGGADLGDDPYRVTAQLADVLDLVPQASVKVNDVAVGRVSGIRLPCSRRYEAEATKLSGKAFVITLATALAPVLCAWSRAATHPGSARQSAARNATKRPRVAATPRFLAAPGSSGSRRLMIVTSSPAARRIGAASPPPEFTTTISGLGA